LVASSGKIEVLFTGFFLTVSWLRRADFSFRTDLSFKVALPLMLDTSRRGLLVLDTSRRAFLADGLADGFSGLAFSPSALLPAHHQEQVCQMFTAGKLPCHEISLSQKPPHLCGLAGSHQETQLLGLRKPWQQVRSLYPSTSKAWMEENGGEGKLVRQHEGYKATSATLL
jgi:hypothetical protein